MSTKSTRGGRGWLLICFSITSSPARFHWSDGRQLFQGVDRSVQTSIAAVMETQTNDADEVLTAVPPDDAASVQCEMDTDCDAKDDDAPIANGLHLEENDEKYYSHGADYWSKVPATVDGMLGGFGYISHTDIQGSETFLRSIFKLKNPPCQERAIDCGAGIGRITKLLLQKHFDKVDLVEQNPQFLNEAKTYLGPSKHVGQMFCEGLQNFKGEENSYDMIWCQWVLGQLKDHDLITFMKSNVRALRENGLIIVKENVTLHGDVEEDKVDASVTRSEKALLALLTGPAGLRVVREMKQSRFPKGLFPVKMYALRPQKIEKENSGEVMESESNNNRDN